MAELDDIPVRDSVFYSTPSDDGGADTISEFAYGLKYDYRATNASGSWTVVAYDLHPLGSIPITKTVSALDVSNHQPADLSDLIRTYHPDHVIVKLYQSIEIAGGRAHSLAQIKSVQNHRKTVGGYGWLYRNQGESIRTCLTLLEEAQIKIPILWIDVEPYQDVYPRVQDIRKAVQVCTDHGQSCGIYTGKWVWDVLGNPTEFSYLPLWHSHFGIEPSLNLMFPYGGWTTCVGHQYSSTPIDQNMFLREYTVVAT